MVSNGTMKRVFALAAMVAVSGTVAGFAAHQTARLSDPLERAVALVLKEPPEPVAAFEGGLDAWSHPPDYAGTLDALVFVLKLTWLGLFLGGIPLALAGWIMDRRNARRVSRCRPRSIFWLQTAFVCQLSSLMVTGLLAALLIGEIWPIQTIYVLGAAILAFSAAANIVGIRAWTRIRVRSTAWPHALKIGEAAPQG